MVPFLGGPYDKDCTIFGSILGSPILGSYQIRNSSGQVGQAKTFKSKCSESVSAGASTCNPNYLLFNSNHPFISRYNRQNCRSLGSQESLTLGPGPGQQQSLLSSTENRPMITPLQGYLVVSPNRGTPI